MRKMIVFLHQITKKKLYLTQKDASSLKCSQVDTKEIFDLVVPILIWERRMEETVNAGGRVLNHTTPERHMQDSGLSSNTKRFYELDSI